MRQATSNPHELSSLYRDLLIGVTQFFRDREAFDLLENDVLPELLAKVPPNEEFRAWVAGCATGEEAYSLAMLIHEQLTRLGRPIRAKVFATDVHQMSLDVAGTALYSGENLADVSPERRERYFVRQGDRYQVGNELRQMIVFATHNLLKDAPFTRLDLVTCRNLLIYLQAAAQRKVISLFHFGLKSGAVLLLGPSENVGDLEEEFTPIDRHTGSCIASGAMCGCRQKYGCRRRWDYRFVAAAGRRRRHRMSNCCACTTNFSTSSFRQSFS